MTRVGITSDRFAMVADRYEEVGLQPVHLPCVTFEPRSEADLTRARTAAANAGLLVATSPRIISTLWPSGGMPSVEVAAVGSATASATTRAGGAVVLIGDAGLARLAERIADRPQVPRMVLTHAEGSEPAALTRLRQLAPDLEEHVIYEMRPTSPSLDPVEAVAFASPSAVFGWALSRSLDDVVVGAIGPTTARAVATVRSPDVVADTPSHDALARAIAAFMEVPA